MRTFSSHHGHHQLNSANVQVLKLTVSSELILQMVIFMNQNMSVVTGSILTMILTYIVRC